MSENVIQYIKGGIETTIDIETLQKLIAEILQIENLSFLVGAGCSSNIVNGQELGISTMYQLYKKFFKKNATFSVNDILLENKFENNLEKLMEFLLALNIVNYEFIASKKEIDNQIDKKISIVKNFLLEEIKALAMSISLRICFAF